MTGTGFQVIVRGAFTGLDDASRSRLLADADRHDLFSARFTPEGVLTYDRSLAPFSLRYLIGPAEADDTGAAQVVAERRAREALAAAGLGHGGLRSTATDLAGIKVRRRARRH